MNKRSKQQTIRVAPRKYKKDEQNPVKCLFVGPSGCGKTSFISVYKKLPFPREYIPTVIDTFSSNIQIGEKLINLCIWDTAGQEDLNRLLDLVYSDKDFVIYCYSIEDYQQITQLGKEWIPAMQNYAPNSMSILLGMKKDLRDSSLIKQEDATTYEDGKEFHENIGTCFWTETSALQKENIDDVFKFMADFAIKHIFTDESEENDEISFWGKLCNWFRCRGFRN